MDKTVIDIFRQLTTQLEQFLHACKSEGDTTIEDVLKRLEDLKKET
nr:hypothetical protein 8 [bacterium]